MPLPPPPPPGRPPWRTHGWGCGAHLVHGQLIARMACNATPRRLAGAPRMQPARPRASAVIGNHEWHQVARWALQNTRPTATMALRPPSSPRAALWPRHPRHEGARRVPGITVGQAASPTPHGSWPRWHRAVVPEGAAALYPMKHVHGSWPMVHSPKAHAHAHASARVSVSWPHTWLRTRQDKHACRHVTHAYAGAYTLQSCRRRWRAR